MSPVAEVENVTGPNVNTCLNSRKLYSARTFTRSGMPSSADIIDIRSDRNHVQTTLKDEILSMLKPDKGPKAMPTLLLYDGKGLQIFEEVAITLIPCTTYAN